MGFRIKPRLIKWSNIIATGATSVLAVTALITVYLTITAWKVQQETTRPYFVLKESPKVEISDELSLELRFNNVGVHPAVDLSSETVVFNEQLSAKPIYYDESSIVNEIPKDGASSLIVTIPSEEIYPKQDNIDPQYVVVDLQYRDPILKKFYNQTIYMKWRGERDGKMQPIVHVQVEEKDNIIKYFNNYGIDPKVRSH
ncbi:hypothetical protein Desor_0047 [Desulfosporosinus orientis DSM 765]|uniref:Uncharacterized protein n=1 Tax=Desulfosporosinus orientis (strain ATCC 19365 / DSM 765 / NCIMB 8382 / VKM B-1628 / Singapore I) TaxID=768706 RepID=G7W7D4_DESOD|nr:hypothetical protein Desor_0047 [Desulfosporosinus orientis DSM 765]